MKFKVYHGNICVYSGDLILGGDFHVDRDNLFEMAAKQYHTIEGWRFDWPVEVEIFGHAYGTRKTVNREVKYSFKVGNDD